ncbi:MAG: FecR domain-containing protein, partial [Candidatus Moranbacteria bacterium]|nr:FecR domain-containing protein [Candidatus Moranbacteria bacterium]
MQPMQMYRPQTYPRGLQGPNRAGRALKQWIGFIVLLSIVGVVLYWYFSHRGKKFDVSLSATKGSVEYRENEKGEWEPIGVLPLKLQPSSEVRTLNDSGAEISLDANGIIRMGSFSRLVLTDNQGKVAWVQTDGDSHYQVAKNDDRKEYKVALSDGEILAEGTAFEIKSNNDDTTILVLDGTVRALYKDRSSQEAKAGEKIIVNPVGKRVLEMSEEDL